MRYKNKNIRVTTQMQFVDLREGQSIEEMLRAMKASKTPMDVETAPEIFQERSAGVDPMCDIRTDKMELAQQACDKITRTHLLARANRGDFGKKKAEEFSYVTDTNGNIVENPVLKKSNNQQGGE